MNILEQTNDNHINFKKNGKLFPTWITNNFKNYLLDAIKYDDANDPCSKSTTQIIEKKLHKYQSFIGTYLSLKSPYHDILLYHGLGSGKTISAINVFNVLFSANEDTVLFLFIKASLHDKPWMEYLNFWLEKEKMMDKIQFIHYDAPNASTDFDKKLMSTKMVKNKLFIIEEAHNFIKNVYSNLSKQEGTKALLLYNGILAEKKTNKYVRVICLSGTPIIDTPYELAILFNLLRPNIFPNSEDEFNNIFLLNGKINPDTKNMFQRRIIGLVSHYAGNIRGRFASKKIIYVETKMSKYQQQVYNYYNDIESQKSKSLYRTYTRQSCNFVFPVISDFINGINRPRPKSFMITENDVTSNITDNKNVKKYLDTINKFVNSFDDYLSKSNEQDLVNKYTIFDDINNFVTNFISNNESNFDEFISFNKHSILFSNMFACSHKMTRLIFNIFLSKGPVMIYSNFVAVEGLEILKIYLKYFGYSNFVENKNTTNKYVEFLGGIDKKQREFILDNFNDKTNIHGNKIKIILISPAGSEGISLKNVRQVHILEPYWHNVRTEQIIGRAIRDCSHADLPISERHVDVYQYISTHDIINITADQHIYSLSKEKDDLVNVFTELLREISVDCVLNKNHNKSTYPNCKCFQFEENKLLSENIDEPAYFENIYEDIKNNNGLNSPNSYVARVKVVKIKAIKLLKNNKHTEEEYFWLNDATGSVYDFITHMFVGKIMKQKLNDETYVIDKYVKVPLSF